MALHAEGTLFYRYLNLINYLLKITDMFAIVLKGKADIQSRHKMVKSYLEKFIHSLKHMYAMKMLQ